MLSTLYSELAVIEILFIEFIPKDIYLVLNFLCHSFDETSCGILLSCQALSNFTTGGFFVQR